MPGFTIGTISDGRWKTTPLALVVVKCQADVSQIANALRLLRGPLRPVISFLQPRSQRGDDNECHRPPDRQVIPTTLRLHHFAHGM